MLAAVSPYTITTSKPKYMGAGGGGASSDRPGTANDFIYVQVHCMFQTYQREKCAITIMNIANKHCKSLPNLQQAPKNNSLE